MPIKVKITQASMRPLEVLEQAKIEGVYVISDCVEAFEEAAINILISEHNYAEMFTLFRRWMEVYIEGTSERGIEQIPINDIYYIEAFGNDVEAVLEKRRIKIKDKLYMIEESLQQYSFCRISKSIIINLDKIQVIKKILNGKILITLDQNEELEVNRTFVKQFKEELERRK